MDHQAWINAITHALQALAPFAWPLIVAVILIALYPSLKQAIASHGLKVKIGDFEITAQQGMEQLATQLNDLMDKVQQLREQQDESEAKKEMAVAESETSLSGEDEESLINLPPIYNPIRNVLWVDDNPSNNAFEIQKLRREGIGVAPVTTTLDALRLIAVNKYAFDAIISDMGRKDNGNYEKDAGIRLIKAARNSDFPGPIFIYTAPRAVEHFATKVKEAGGNGTTASPIELFEWLSRAASHHADCGDGPRRAPARDGTEAISGG